MKRHAIPIIAILAVCSAATARALDSEDVKDSTESLSCWLIDQYDAKAHVFGKDEQAKDVVQVSMVLVALSECPTDYKESNGPFISAPVKYILSKKQADGTYESGHPFQTEVLNWVVAALEAQKNEKHNAEIHAAREKLAALAENVPEDFASHVKNPLLGIGDFELQTFANEIERSPSAAVKKAKYAELAANIIKHQEKNGSFGNDIKESSRMLRVLSICYKGLDGIADSGERNEKHYASQRSGDFWTQESGFYDTRLQVDLTNLPASILRTKP